MDFLEGKCRFCLDSVDILDQIVINEDIRHQFKDLTNTQLLDFHSDLPNFSCQNCLDILNSSVTAKKRFIENQKLLLEKYNKITKLKSENIQGIVNSLDSIKREDVFDSSILDVNIKEENDTNEQLNFPTVEFIKDEPVSDQEELSSTKRLQDITLEIGSTINHKLNPCKICGKLLKKGSHRMHMRRVHVKQKSFFCDLCNRGFFFKHLILNHVKVHFKIRDVKCTDCEAMFCTRSGMLNHVKIAHRGKQKHNPRTCEYCGQICFNKVSYDGHVRSKHTGDRAFKCDFVNCDKSYFTAKDLSVHKKSAHTEPSECQVCFKRVGDLTRHMKSHRSRDFICTYRDDNGVCQKAFIANHKLQKHINTAHRGIKTHFCQECDASFTKSDSLSDHVRVVHRKIKIKCELCSTLVTRRDYYRRHINLHHKELDEVSKQEILDRLKTNGVERLYNSTNC